MMATSVLLILMCIGLLKTRAEFRSQCSAQTLLILAAPRAPIDSAPPPNNLLRRLLIPNYPVMSMHSNHDPGSVNHVPPNSVAIIIRNIKSLVILLYFVGTVVVLNYFLFHYTASRMSRDGKPCLARILLV